MYIYKVYSLIIYSDNIEIFLNYNIKYIKALRWKDF